MRFRILFLLALAGAAGCAPSSPVLAPPDYAGVAADRVRMARNAEEAGDPEKALGTALTAEGIPAERFRVPIFGETVTLGER